MKNLNGKVAVVTGAASGIGRALAVELARAGASVALCDIDADGLEQTSRQCSQAGSDSCSWMVDVGDRAAVAAFASEVVDRFGVVNLVINNAGITAFGTVLESSYDDVERILDVDFWGVVHGTVEFLPHLISSGEGHIVNVSSVFGLFGVPTQSAYSAAKFAVRGYAESLRQEMRLGGHPVGVTCVHPGGVRTDIIRNANSVTGRDGSAVGERFDRIARTTPEAAARTIVRAYGGTGHECSSAQTQKCSTFSSARWDRDTEPPSPV